MHACACVCAQRFNTSVVVCATFGSLACCLHLKPQEMENGSQFLKLMLRSDRLKTQLFSGRASHCERSCSFWDKCTAQLIINDKSTC